MDAAAVEAAVREQGSLIPGRAVVVLLSGGRDSVCLLDLAIRVSGAVTALHVNYGLREDADADEAHCRALCARLGVPIEVCRPAAPNGNVQAWAREQRYAYAARLPGDIATGHTSDDQVETVLYRLAASPGRRALLGIRPRDGRLVRPLLGIPRAATGAYCEERGLAYRDDPSNDSLAYARNRVRHELVTALRSVHPAADANVLRTLSVLRDEAAVLDDAVRTALATTGSNVAKLAALPPALRRLALQHLAGAGAPAIGSRADEILALGSRGGTATLDLGGGLRAVVSYGALHFERRPSDEPDPEPVTLEVPGHAPFGSGAIDCRLHPQGQLDAEALGRRLEVRPWRAGDRMRPAGLGGSKSLQDLFTDRRVPRQRRHRIPVVVAGDEIAWIPGVATGEAFAVTPQTTRRARLTWREP